MARPLMYETWERAKKVKIKDSFGNNDFVSEKDLCDYIDINAPYFCRDILEEDYVSHEREWDINQYRIFGPRNRAVDFMFKTKSSECVLVECKNPTNTYLELRNSISQLMAYRLMSKRNMQSPNRCLLITTEYHPVVGEMIKEYNLPFEIYLLSKKQIFKMKEVL